MGFWNWLFRKNKAPNKIEPIAGTRRVESGTALEAELKVPKTHKEPDTNKGYKDVQGMQSHPKEDAIQNARNVLLEYLKARKPTSFNCIADASKLNTIIRFYEEYASTKLAPRLSHYVLTPTSKQGSKFPVVVATTGELSEQQKQSGFNVEAIRERVLPGKSWSDLWGGGGESRSNYALPGCSLGSLASFNELVRAIEAGSYDVIRVLTPTDKTAQHLSGKDATLKGSRAATNQCQSCSKDLGAQGVQWHYDRPGSIDLVAYVGFKCKKCGHVRCIDHIEEGGKEIKTCPDCGTRLVAMMEGPE